MESTGFRSFRIERTCQQTGCAEWARERGCFLAVWPNTLMVVVLVIKRGISRLGGEGLHEMNSLGKFLMPGDGHTELSRRWFVGYMSLQDIWAGDKNPGVQRPDETTLGESKEKRSTAQALRHSNCRNCRKEEKPVKQRRHRWGGRKEATTQEMWFRLTFRNLTCPEPQAQGHLSPQSLLPWDSFCHTSGAAHVFIFLQWSCSWGHPYD